MDLRFEFTQEDKWPPLAWIAECVESEPVIRVRHGPQVETQGSWFCEAIWDGEFEIGDFDRTDLVFGSGARLRDGQALFVSSASTVDRLQFLRLTDKVLVSNSLACLLAVSGTNLDLTAGRWFEFFRSVADGIDAYARRLPTESGNLELVYFRNVVWDGCQLVEQDKPAPVRDFGSFANYYGFLTSALERIAGNMSAVARGHCYEMLGTLSSGYDSVTAATLCRHAGMRNAVSSRTAREAGGEDHGAEIAKILGLELTIFDRRAWRTNKFAEVPFLASNPRGGDVFFGAAEPLLRGRVLVTGFHGDKVWGKDTKALGPDVVRGDMSGMSLCEYRLLLGCIHFPLAFMGVRQIRDINTLSNSLELSPWDVPGEYSRPICRRIIEDAEIPRGLFGVKKKMASVHFGQGESLLSEETRAEYHSWLRENSEILAQSETGRPNVPSKLLLVFRERYYLLSKLAHNVTRPFPAKAEKWVGRKLSALQRSIDQRINVPEYMFPWAIERMVGLYRKKERVDKS